MKFKSTYACFVILIISIGASLLMKICIHEGHDWGDDFALYISQTQALLNGAVNDLYQQNYFTIQHSIKNIGPYLYPFGFPLLLSPIYKFFGLNFMALKAFCGLFFITSFGLIFFVFKPAFKQAIFSLFVLLFIAFNVHFLTYVDYVQSDLPFFFFCFLSLYLMTRCHSVYQLILLGLVLFFTYTIRDAGIVLVPTLFVYQWQHNLKNSQLTKRKLLIYFMPHIVFCALFVINYLSMPHGGENHFAMIKNGISTNLIKENYFYYLDLVFTFCFKNPVSNYLYHTTYFLVLIGALVKWKTHSHWILFVSLNFLLLLIWPYKQGIRFIFPILPFLIYFIIQSLIYLFEKMKITTWVLMPLLLFLVWNNMLYNYKEINIYAKKQTNECLTDEMKSIYKFIDEDVPKHEIVGFEKPRVLRLFSHRNAIWIDMATWENAPANYILVWKGAYLGESIKYETILKTESFYLLKKTGI